jgi:hypothetical protein
VSPNSEKTSVSGDGPLRGEANFLLRPCGCPVGSARVENKVSKGSISHKERRTFLFQCYVDFCKKKADKDEFFLAFFSRCVEYHDRSKAGK